MTKPVTSTKGFNADMTCLGFQYEVGRSYSIKGPVVQCERGFHACREHPLDVWHYYPPLRGRALTRYAVVEQSGEMMRSLDKIASTSITIKAELSLREFIQRGIDYVASKTKHDIRTNAFGFQSVALNEICGGVAANVGLQGIASSARDSGVSICSGDQGIATAEGCRSIAATTGRYDAATSTGHRSVATTTGDRGAAIAAGHWNIAAGTGDQNIAISEGVRGAAVNTGDWSIAKATGERSIAASVGYATSASAEGEASIAISISTNGAAKACAGSGIVLVYRDKNSYGIKHLFSAMVGQRGIQADTWYRLDENGQPYIVKEDEL